jgi:hypothetical protein
LEFKLKTGPQGHIYLPKKIRDTFGDNLTLLPNSVAAAVYPNNADLNDVIASLQVIISDLKLRSEFTDSRTNLIVRRGSK